MKHNITCSILIEIISHMQWDRNPRARLILMDFMISTVSFRITVTVQSIQKTSYVRISSTSQSKPNVSQALLPLGFPSLLFTLLPRVVKTLQWISASEILLQTQQMKTVFIQSAITGSVFTHNSSPVNYRSLSLTKIRFNLYMKSLFAKT